MTGAVPFTDRADAGRQLAARLAYLRGEDVVVVGLPRGGVPVAFEVARALGAPLDVVLVRKLGVPFQPELGMGAVGEGGVRVLNPLIVRRSGVTDSELAAVEEREGEVLRRRAEALRGRRPRVPLKGRTVVVVDDGIATGSTALAACQVVRAHDAARVVLATPVIPPDILRQLGADVDDLVCLRTPEPMHAIGLCYQDFSQVSDEEVGALLELAERALARPHAGPGAASGSAEAPAEAEDPPDRDEDVELLADGVRLAGRLTVPRPAPGDAGGVVLFAHGSGSSRHSPRNRQVAAVLNAAGLGTLLFDLLTPNEEADRSNVFDIPLLAERLAGATGWLRGQPDTAGASIGYFGASTGAAAALWAAAEVDGVAAVVSRGGRPDLAGPRLSAVRAATLLIVGGNDELVLQLNRAAAAELRCQHALRVVPGASHLFEEPGTLQQVALLARDWFVEHLAAAD